jgi:SPOR domain
MKGFFGLCLLSAAWLAACNQYPNTPQPVDAGNRSPLRDEQAWARAKQDQIAANERSTAWTAASMTDTPDALEAFLQKYPQGPEADQAKARLAQLSGYRVQLATFRSEEQAEKTRDRLQGKYGDVLGSVDIVPGATEDVHVVRSASMGQGEANNACAKLKRDHLPCEVIKDANS